MRGVRGTAKARPTKAQLATAKGRSEKTFRWPEEIRVKMAVALIGQLSMSEVMAVRDGGDLPTRHKGLTDAYKQVRAEVREWLRQRYNTADKDMPSAAALRKAARRSAKKLMCNGNVHDAPPHRKGFKMTIMRRRVLRKIYDLLLLGYKAPSGKMFPFRSMKHAIALSREIADLVGKLGLKRVENVWRMLRTECPDLYVGKLLTMKIRDCWRAQVHTPSLDTHAGCQLTGVAIERVHACLNNMISWCMVLTWPVCAC